MEAGSGLVARAKVAPRVAVSFAVAPGRSPFHAASNTARSSPFSLVSLPSTNVTVGRSSRVTVRVPAAPCARSNLTNVHAVRGEGRTGAGDGLEPVDFGHMLGPYLRERDGALGLDRGSVAVADFGDGQPTLGDVGPPVRSRKVPNINSSGPTRKVKGGAVVVARRVSRARGKVDLRVKKIPGGQESRARRSGRSGGTGRRREFAVRDVRSLQVRRSDCGCWRRPRVFS